MKCVVLLCWLRANHLTWPKHASTCLVKTLYWHSIDIDILLTLIASIVNLSLFERSFPLQVCSRLNLLNKPTLSKDNTKNYWLVCAILLYFPRLSRKLWRTICTHSHWYSSTESNHYQSAFRKFQSTETALLKIHNDSLSSLDAGKVTRSWHWLCLNFLLPLIPSTILFSWEDLMISQGLLGRHSTSLKRIWLE